MVARELIYLDFDVLLERVGKSRRKYRARVVNAPAGQGSQVAFTLPFTSQDLTILVLRIGRPQRPVRRVDAPETKAIKDFGHRLYDALFHDDLRVSLERSLSEATANGAGLRLRLRLSDTPELAELPWEFLYDRSRNRFVCLSDRTPLVRFLEVPDPPRPLPVSPPLRVLVMISSPRDPSFAELDVEQEWTKLQVVLSGLEQDGLVQLERLETATLSALRQRLRRDDWHVLHFIGHGGFDTHAQDGVLVLEDQAGGSRLVGAQALGVPLHNHDPLRLVVLNACEGARSDPTDPFAGTAQTLIQQGIPAVVAMQFEITDPAAIAFTSELYDAVAAGYPLDAALSQARQAIYTDVSEVEWATPVLYLRAPDGRIFDVTPTLPAAIPRPPPATAPAPEAGSRPPPSELPPELLEALSSEAEGRRVEAVAELGRLLHAAPGEVAEQARALLQQLIDDDSRPVRRAAIRALSTRPSAYWTRGEIERLHAELAYPGARAVLDEAAHRAPRSVLLREVSERTGSRTEQISAELGAMTKLCKRLFGRDAWPVTFRSTADGASYQMDPEIAHWWRQASDPDAQSSPSDAQPTTTRPLATSSPSPESGLADLAPALEVATRVAADRRQGAVPLEFASAEEAAAYRDRLRSALTERTAAGDAAIGHVRPWVWTPASSGRALTEAGNRTGVEVRLSYYR